MGRAQFDHPTNAVNQLIVFEYASGGHGNYIITVMPGDSCPRRCAVVPNQSSPSVRHAEKSRLHNILLERNRKDLQQTHKDI